MKIIAHLDIILPIVILVLAFMLRLFIDRSVNKADIIETVCELPSDMIFLSLSFLMAYTISHSKSQAEGLLYSLINVIIAIVIVAMRKRSITSITDHRRYIWLGWFVPNFLIAVTTLIFSIYLLNDKSTDNPESDPIEQSLDEKTDGN